MWAHDPWSAQDESTSNEKCTPGPLIIEFESLQDLIWPRYYFWNPVWKESSLRLRKSPATREWLSRKELYQCMLAVRWPMTMLMIISQFFTHDYDHLCITWSWSGCRWSYWFRDQVLVVGGGPSGLSAALAARRAGAEVILMERWVLSL